MLNLIINEYAKIFHKKSTYILLIILIAAIVGMPIFSKALSTFEDSYTYFPTYDEEISWAEDSGDIIYVELLKKAQEYDIPPEEVYWGDSGWRYSALNELYYDYWMNFSMTTEQMLDYYDCANEEELAMYHNIPNDATKKEHETIFNEGVKYIANNDWKGFFEFKIKLIDNNVNYSPSEKDSLIYFYQYMVDNNIEPGTDSWQEEALNTYNHNVQQYEDLKAAKEAGEYYDEKSFAASERITLISKYRLDNNVSAAIYEFNEDEFYSEDDIYLYTGKFYNNMKNGVYLLIVVMIISLIIAGNIVSKEFSQGTIKFLLINPVKRSKIFWSKYITVFSYTFILTVITFILEYVMSMIVFGTAETGTQLLTVEAGQVISHSAFSFMALRYLLAFVKLFVVFTIAFMISSLFRNSALAISISMIIYFASSAACEVASMLNLDFFRYTIFANIDLTTIMIGKSHFVYMTVGFAVTAIAIHIVLLLLTAYDAFTKKNV